MGKGIYHEPVKPHAPKDAVPGVQDGKNPMYTNPEPGQNFPTGVQGTNEGSPWSTPGIQHTLDPKKGR